VGENHLLVDTDVLIAYLNRRSHREYLDDSARHIYYSAVTKKELLSKPGLKASERGAILALLRKFRQVRIDSRVARVYPELRSSNVGLGQPDALIAASALARRLPLFTLNVRHFARVKGLSLINPGRKGSERAQQIPEKRSQKRHK
jgi:predicted nucleic acid-binding protein